MPPAMDPLQSSVIPAQQQKPGERRRLAGLQVCFFLELLKVRRGEHNGHKRRIRSADGAALSIEASRPTGSSYFGTLGR
jgi:hypothetical protein